MHVLDEGIYVSEGGRGRVFHVIRRGIAVHRHLLELEGKRAKGPGKGEERYDSVITAN
jgi:hypothetical protein